MTAANNNNSNNNTDKAWPQQVPEMNVGGHPDSLQFSPNQMLLACLDAATVKVMVEHFKACGIHSW